MAEIAVVAPAPIAAPPAGQVAPVAVSGQPAWLEHRDPVTGGIPFRYVLVAEDAHGNVSSPSRLATGRALRARPVAPVWNPAVRNGDTVELSWTHPDPGLSCLVERRIDGAGAWRATGGWLPRGVYSLHDANPLGELAWEYRLRVRDEFGLLASDRPVIRLPASVT
jgi:hypothetical protein